MAVMILSVGIVHGFQNEVRQKVIGFGSHLQISLYNPQNALGAKPMDAEQPFFEKILAEPAVKSIQAFAYKSGIITANGNIQGVMNKGFQMILTGTSLSPTWLKEKHLAFLNLGRTTAS